MSKSSYEKCYASYPGRSNEIDTARAVLQRHGKFCADAVREFAQQADMSISESHSILRCLWRDTELERLQAENKQLREDLEFERSENGWAREFLNRMGQKCGTKDCPSLVAYVAKLEKENAKLREERDDWHDEQAQAFSNWRDAYERTIELSTENSKLREFVTDMYQCADPCNDCPHYNSSSDGFYCDLGAGWKTRRMRELGIKTDG